METNENDRLNRTSPVWYEFRNIVYSEQFDEAERLLSEVSDLRSMTNGCGETALHFLAIENDWAGVLWLHERGFSIDTVDAFGEPVIFVVAQLRYKELFSWFVSKGANLYAKNREGLDIISHLRDYDKDDMADWIKSTFLEGKDLLS